MLLYGLVRFTSFDKFRIVVIVIAVVVGVTVVGMETAR